VTRGRGEGKSRRGAGPTHMHRTEGEGKSQKGFRRSCLPEKKANRRSDAPQKGRKGDGLSRPAFILKGQGEGEGKGPNPSSAEILPLSWWGKKREIKGWGVTVQSEHNRGRPFGKLLPILQVSMQRNWRAKKTKNVGRRFQVRGRFWGKEKGRGNVCPNEKPNGSVKVPAKQEYDTGENGDGGQAKLT